MDPRVIALLESAFLGALRRMHALTLQRLGRQDAARVTIKGVKSLISGETPRLVDAVARAAAIADQVNAKKLRQIPGINPNKIVGSDKVARFRSRAVGLIKTIEAKYLGDVERTLAQGQGLHVEALTKRLQERFAVSESRARFWARDQALKLNSAVTQDRFAAAGIARYVWTTANDDRVRGNPSGLYPDAEPDHWAREGKEFALDDPPEGGHPGEDYNCRCVMFPVLGEAPAAPTKSRGIDDFAALSDGVTEAALDFARDGYRAPLTAYAGVPAAQVNDVATGLIPPPGSTNPLPPIRIEIHPPGNLVSGKTLQLVDGRHRLQAGATLIRAELIKRGKRGGILARTIRNIPVPR